MQHGERERSLQVEVARLRKLHEDAEDARCVLLAELRAANARADAATTKAEQYERDWYAAKNDFGNAMAKSREALAAARRECDLKRGGLRSAHEYCLYMFNKEWLTDPRNRSVFAARIFAILDSALAAPAAAAGEDK